MRPAVTVLLVVITTPPSPADPPPAGKLPPGALARVDAPDPPGWEEVALSPDGRRLARRVKDYRAPENSRVDVTDLTTGRTVALRDASRMAWQVTGELPHGPWDVSLAFSPDGTELATANYSGSVAVWDAATGKHLRDVPLPARKVEPADADRDPTTRAMRVFPARGGFMIETHRLAYHALEAKTGKLTRHPDGEPGGTTTSGWSPDGRFVGRNDLQASVEDSVFVHDVERGRLLFSGNTPPNSYAGRILPSPDGALVATTYSDTTTPGAAGVLLWRVDGKQEVPLEGGKGWKPPLPEVLAFSPDGKVFCGVRGQRVLRWETATGKRLADWVLPAKAGRVAFDWPRARIAVVAGGLVRAVEMPR